ncbi:MAG TPA: type IV toxin-antitoxin system AbiEi family antitoxin domain-containing protein [Ktedonobacterales bacterium]|nr:type IV toxin-antitoxin system AbiEi family antitoxin domain-containing protein [Ktedonobacterales bacterium]
MPQKQPTSAERLEDYLSEHSGLARVQDLRELGIDRRALYTLAAEGALQRVGQGLYRSTDAEITPTYDDAEAVLAVPQGVICLISALVHHDLTDEIPLKIHMAIEGKAWPPRIAWPPIRFYSFSGEAFHAGIEEIELDGIPVKIYNKEKTIADCLKYRHRIPPGVPQQALREALRKRDFSFDRLLQYARICRVEPLVRTYVEVL